MHIGDGLLNGTLLIPLWIICFAYMALALFKARKGLQSDQIPIVSVLTAVVFAFQMLNFPIALGTSGHFLGFILLAILTTPSMGFIMISVVLIIQAFLFADGGIVALGANMFNMGIATLPGYFTYWIIRKKMMMPVASNHEMSEDYYAKTPQYEDKGLLLGAFVGAYVSLISASFICGIEIGLSSNFPYGISFTIPAMLGYHAIIGLGEAMITTFVVLFFKKQAPEYIPDIQKIPIWS